MKKNYLKHYFIAITALFTVSSIAQQARLATSQKYELDWDVCVYKPTDEAALINNARRQFVKDRMDNNRTPCANFIVNYGPGFTANPQAQAAFQYAVDIWANLISSPVQIRVTANFDPAASGNLGSAGSDGFFTLTGPGIPANTLYPSALTEAILGEDTDGPSGVSNDINANFNSNRTDWYFGTDGNPPSNQFDFVSVVLHELGHGLGVLGFGRQDGSDNNIGLIRFSGNASIWDNFIEVENVIIPPFTPTPILNTTSYPDPSAQLMAAFEGDGLMINAPIAVAQNGGSAPKTFAPSNFQPGSSYSHLDESTFNGTPHALMTPFGANGEANHDPGDIILGFMEDMGWVLCQGSLSTPDFAASDIKINPNPFTNRITIDLPNNLSASSFDVTIFDINGRMVLEQKTTISGNEISITHLDDLKPSLYFMTLSSQDSDLTITKKLIKN